MERPTISSGRETSVNELARMLAGRDFRHGPAKAGEQRRSAVDAAAARKELGWEPRIPLEQGLQDTAAWFRSRNRP